LQIEGSEEIIPVTHGHGPQPAAHEGLLEIVDLLLHQLGVRIAAGRAQQIDVVQRLEARHEPGIPFEITVVEELAIGTAHGVEEARARGRRLGSEEFVRAAPEERGLDVAVDQRAGEIVEVVRPQRGHVGAVARGVAEGGRGLALIEVARQRGARACPRGLRRGEGARKLGRAAAPEEEVRENHHKAGEGR
jgi:hypothetical protein